VITENHTARKTGTGKGSGKQIKIPYRKTENTKEKYKTGKQENRKTGKRQKGQI
jgi:hypothetical protein